MLFPICIFIFALLRQPNKIFHCVRVRNSVQQEMSLWAHYDLQNEHILRLKTCSKENL